MDFQNKFLKLSGRFEVFGFHNYVSGSVWKIYEVFGFINKASGALGMTWDPWI